MAYGENNGRFREIRIGRSEANMGGEGPPVKWTDLEQMPKRAPQASKKLQNTSGRQALEKSIFSMLCTEMSP
jgi:hypothetical protein